MRPIKAATARRRVLSPGKSLRKCDFMAATDIVDSTRYGSGWKDRKCQNWVKIEPKYSRKGAYITSVWL